MENFKILFDSMNQKDFRIAGKNLILEYKDCHDYGLEDIAKHLSDKLLPYSVTEYLVIGNNYDVFCFFSLSKRLDTKNRSYFDLKIYGKIRTGNYRTSKDSFSDFCQMIHERLTPNVFEHFGSPSLFRTLSLRLRHLEEKLVLTQKVVQDPDEDGNNLKYSRVAEKECDIQQYFSFNDQESTNYSLRSPTLSSAFNSYPPSKSSSLSSNTCKMFEQKIKMLEEQNASYREENRLLREDIKRREEEHSKQIMEMEQKCTRMFNEMQKQICQLIDQKGQLYTANLELRKSQG